MHINRKNVIQLLYHTQIKYTLQTALNLVVTFIGPRASVNQHMRHLANIFVMCKNDCKVRIFELKSPEQVKVEVSFQNFVRALWTWVFWL